MEFAVSAVFLLVLLLPGFILQTAYTKGFWRWNSPTSSRSLTEQVPAAIVIASALHALWAGGAAVIGSPVNLGSVMMLLTGAYGHEEAHFESALSSLTGNPYKVFFYFASLCSVAALTGYVSHFAVRQLGLDRSTRILRFNNHWFYLLSGEITEFNEFGGSPAMGEDVDGVLLTTIVHHGDGDYLYRGLVVEFFFDKDGTLDRVLLVLAARRKLADDRKREEEPGSPESEARYYDIEGDYFVLKYSEMHTINVDYLFVVPEGTSITETNDNIVTAAEHQSTSQSAN